MSPLFFEKPRLNSPCGHPRWHWDLDASNQPTHIKVLPPTWENLKCRIGISSSHSGQHAAPYAFTEQGVVSRSSVLNAPVHQAKVKVNCVDVFHPNTGDKEESLFVRHAYLLGSSDPNISLKKTLKANMSAGARKSLHSDSSRSFEKSS